MGDHNDTLRHIKDKPHSFEFGKPNNKTKLYFNDIVELKNMLEALHKWGLIQEIPNYNEKEVESDGRKETN